MEAFGHPEGKNVCVSFQPEMVMKLPILGELLLDTFHQLTSKYGRQDQISFFGNDDEIIPKVAEMIKALGPYDEWLKTFSDEIKTKKAEAEEMAKKEFGLDESKI